MTYEMKQEIYKSACYGMSVTEIADINDLPAHEVAAVLENVEELEEVRQDLRDLGVIE